ncbi:hypothetical protein [Streptomyces shenzhenensis]|uniref:hypothetical protein n=1 Tax=Streptomyces shenzhenensis TaxID=943815 RepID=UPI0015F05FBD|nr:hypothetical protein [Streptomyces shenzhenensis]
MTLRVSQRRLGAMLGAGAALVMAGVLVWFLSAAPEAGVHAPEPVSHVDTATRDCLLTSTDVDRTGTWAAMQKTAGVSDSKIVVQRYRLPAGADAVAYVNTLVRLRCSTIVTTGTAARSAVAARLAAGAVPHVRFVVVSGQPLRGTTHLDPDAVSARSLSEAVTGGR